MGLIVKACPHGQGEGGQAKVDTHGQNMCGHPLWMAPCPAPSENRISICLIYFLPNYHLLPEHSYASPFTKAKSKLKVKLSRHDPRSKHNQRESERSE